MSEAPANRSWFHFLFDRGTLRGVGTTLGVFFAVPFALILGLILGGNLARTWERPDLEETLRWGGVLLAVVGVAAGGLVGGLIGAAGDAIRLPVRVATRALIGALTGALVWVGPAALMGVLLVDMADQQGPKVSPEEKQQRLVDNVRTLAVAGAFGGATLGAMLGSFLKKREPLDLANNKAPPIPGFSLPERGSSDYDQGDSVS